MAADHHNDLTLDGVKVSEDAPIPVTVVGVDTDVTLTGDVVVDTLGALNNAKVVDPDAASATLPALSRGQLKQLVDILAKQTAILAAIGAAADAVGANTVIGQLKQIAENTTPA